MTKQELLEAEPTAVSTYSKWSSGISPEQAYRAKIEFLLDESSDERLAYVWQRVFPLPIDPANELPQRRGIIEDLADFAEVLKLNLDGMEAHRLCWLVEKYASYDLYNLSQNR